MCFDSGYPNTKRRCFPATAYLCFSFLGEEDVCATSRVPHFSWFMTRFRAFAEIHGNSLRLRAISRAITPKRCPPLEMTSQLVPPLDVVRSNITYQTSLPTRAKSRTNKRINKVNPCFLIWTTNTAVSLQFPARLEEISASSWCQDKQTPQEKKEGEDRKRGTRGRKCNYSNNSQHNKGKCCVCLHSAVWTKSGRDGILFHGCFKPATVPESFPAYKHFQHASLESRKAARFTTLLPLFMSENQKLGLRDDAVAAVCAGSEVMISWMSQMLHNSWDFCHSLSVIQSKMGFYVTCRAFPTQQQCSLVAEKCPSWIKY